MWIAKSTSWNKRTTQLEKFTIERIIQRCDFAESISNKHRTSNGYTQLKELIKYCDLTFKRSKTNKTLIRLLEEAKSTFVKQNIISDCIVNKYFIDLKEFIEKFDPNRLKASKGQPNLEVLHNLSHKLNVFEDQLDSFYFESLKKELLSIDYTENEKVLRNIELVSNLIDLLIPFLVFKGYSIATIGDILRHWLKCEYHITIKKILSFLHFEERYFFFFQNINTSRDDPQNFAEILKNRLGIEIEVVKHTDIDTELIEEYKLKKNGLFIKYSLSTLDPHTHVRSTFDLMLKTIVAQRERQSLELFNGYFDKCFWTHKRNKPIKKYKRVGLDGDSINVSARGKTLRETLVKLSKSGGNNFEFKEFENIPQTEIDQLQNALYYYNLALGSKSIENSLSLLWTSLESIHPYKIYNSDIDAIQNLVSKGLSIGALSRDIYSFAKRFIQENHQNGNCFGGLGTYDLLSIESSKGLIEWYNWLIEKDKCNKRYEVMKDVSELLTYLFTKLSRSLIEGKQTFILNRLLSSRNSIKFQLQRIYSHRNKIVHSGDMINEYTNLWMHLEWYVGKILSYYITEIHFYNNHSSLNSAFMELEADYDYLYSYLKRNGDKQIAGIPERIITLLFKHSWQAF